MTRARAGLGRWGWILAAVLTVVVVAGGVTATVLWCAAAIVLA